MKVQDHPLWRFYGGCSYNLSTLILCIISSTEDFIQWMPSYMIDELSRSLEQGGHLQARNIVPYITVSFIFLSNLHAAQRGSTPQILTRSQRGMYDIAKKQCGKCTGTYNVVIRYDNGSCQVNHPSNPYLLTTPNSPSITDVQSTDPSHVPSGLDAGMLMKLYWQAGRLGCRRQRFPGVGSI